MEEITIFYILVVTGIFASACSQLLLKKSADKEPIMVNGDGLWVKVKGIMRAMLNWRVITAYAIFFGSLFINITAMSKGVKLKDLPILESLGYVFVPLLSFFILKEKVSRQTMVSIAVILMGVYIFYS